MKIVPGRPPRIAARRLLAAAALLLAGAAQAGGSFGQQDADEDDADAAAAAAEPAQWQVGTLLLSRCHAHVYCGTLPRPFDPTGQVPGSIGIHFELYRHTETTQPSAGTFVAVEGGPGYPSTGTRGSYLRMLRPLLDTKDLLLVDNRGTGGSQAIDCPVLQTEQSTTGPSVADITRCGQQLGRTAPLYSTAYAADDLAAVIAALGRSTVDLYGDSYGTYFSQVFVYRHPELLRSVVLDSAYPVPMVGGESAWYPFFAPTMNQEYDKVCAREAYCASLPGTAMDHIQPALDLLRAHPYNASAHDADGEVLHFRADASMLATVMFAGAPAYTVARELDPAARAYAEGDTAPLLRLMAEAWRAQDPRYHQDDPQLYSEGLFWAVSCQDYAQIYDMSLPPELRQLQRDQHVADHIRTHPDTYAPFTIDEFRGMTLDYSLLDACVRWPTPGAGHRPGPLVPDHPAMPDVPVLVLSGEIDTITTPPEGAAVTSLFPNARQVVLANEFHLTAQPPMFDDCGTQLVRRFFANLDPGDTSCAAAVPPLTSPPKFARHSSALPLPDAQAGNTATPAQLKAAASAVLELRDAIDRIESAHQPTSPALRGGGASHRLEGNIYHLQFDQARFTEDVAVTGRLAWPYGPGTAQGQVEFTTGNGERGTLTVSWPEQQPGATARLDGSIGGHALHATMPAP